MSIAQHEEWLRQADYDLDTAEFMIGGGRYFYAIFMCHLAVEKAMKGLYHFRLNKVPPKTHNLVFLSSEIGLRLSDATARALTKLNEAQVATRYPANLDALRRNITRVIAEAALDETKQVIAWIKQQF